MKPYFTTKKVNGLTNAGTRRRPFISSQSVGLRKKWKNDLAFRKKMSKISRNNWKNPRKRKSITAALKNRLIKSWLSPTYRARMLVVVRKAGPSASRALKKLWREPSYRRKMSQVSMDNWKNLKFKKLRISCAREQMKIKWQNPIFRNKMRKLLLNSIHRFPNKFESRVAKMLNSGFEYCGNGSVLINNQSPDFINKKNKVIVLCQGAYWHCSPRIYKSNYYHVKLRKTAKQIWKEDKNKIELFQRMGYKVIVIWEDEFNKRNRKGSLLKSKIKH